MRVILHIGADKAGSTAIQKTLYRNAARLRERGVILAAQEFEKTNDAHLSEEVAGDRIIRVDDLKSALQWCESQGAEVAIFTFEGFHSVRPWSIEEAAEVLAAYPLQIVYYVREQASYANSALLQRAKGTSQFGLLLDVYHGRQRVALTHNYLSRIEPWRRLLPAARITVREFHPGSLHHGDVVDDFFQCAGLSLDAIVKNTCAVNLSITIESAIALQYLEALGLTRVDEGAMAIGIGQRLGGAKQVLSRKEVLRVRASHLVDNFRLARRYCGRLRMFRLEPLRRRAIDEERVLEILREVGRQLPHIHVDAGFNVEEELSRFAALGFETRRDGVVLNPGESRLMLRCGGRYSLEIYEDLLLEFAIEGPGSGAVEVQGQRQAFAAGEARLRFSLSEFPVFEAFEVIFTVSGGDCVLTRIRAHLS